MSQSVLSDSALPSPYVGLVPYDEKDAPFFFGRESEREIIKANLIASRLTLLYGASGVGKSSVLRAGVAFALRQSAQQNLARRKAKFVVYFNNWRDDPLASLNARIQEEVVHTAPDVQLPSVPADLDAHNLVDVLQNWTERIDGHLLIILDQFEEYFLYHANEDGDGRFAIEFPRAVNRSDLRANFVISIREDGLAKLDRFKGRIPNLFDNYLRIEHLDRDAARDAIIKPLDEYNRRVGETERVSIEPALVDAVLSQVQTQKIVLGDVGRGDAKNNSGQVRIETPYLQLVMRRLWEEERRTHSQALRFVTLERLGNAERIVKTHLDERMNALSANQRDIAARIFRFLVTRSRTKIAYNLTDLADLTQRAKEQIAPVLEKLSSGNDRLLSPVAAPLGSGQESRYEIFHDVLADAVLDWRARYEQQIRTQRLRMIAFAVGTLTLLIFVFLIVLNVNSNTESSRNATQAAQNATQAASNATLSAQNAQQLQDVSQLLLTAVPTTGGNANPTSDAVRATAQAAATNAVQSIAPFNGDWYDNFGGLSLLQDGQNVTGGFYNAYANVSGSITGTVNGNTLDGTWAIGDSKGPLKWTMGPKFDTFDGTWNTNNKWCGARLGVAFPNGCGFAGDWITRVGNNSECAMNITRVDVSIRGTYCEGTFDGYLLFTNNDTVLQANWTTANPAAQNNAGGLKGQLTFFTPGYNGLQFSGNTDGKKEWCGWRAGQAPPSTCLRIDPNLPTPIAKTATPIFGTVAFGNLIRGSDVNCKYGTEGNLYHIRTTNLDQSCKVYLSPSKYENFILNVTTYALEGDGTGNGLVQIRFGEQIDGEAFIINFTRSGTLYSVIRQTSGTVTTLRDFTNTNALSAPAADGSAINKLLIVVRSGVLTIQANGTGLPAIQLPSYKSGQVGLGVRTLGTNAHGAFGDILLSEVTR